MGSNIGSNLPISASAPIRANEIAYNLFSANLVSADPTGVNDSTSAFNAAAASLASGGAVIVPPGTYKLGGVTIVNGVYFIGQGIGITFITTTGSNPAFKTINSNAITSGGIIGFDAQGNASTDTAFDATVDFIDVSLSGTVQNFFVQNNRIYRWRNGWSGSLNDINPIFGANQFSCNNKGIFVYNNHPEFSGTNFFDGNNYGVTSVGTTGGGMYDMEMVGQRFYGGNYGVTDGGHCSITGCEFSGQHQVGVIVGVGCAVTGCQFTTDSAAACVIGVKILRVGAKVSGNMFNSHGLPWTDAAISINMTSGGYGVTIENNRFGDGPDIGHCIVQETGSNDMTTSKISGNVATIYAATSRFLWLKANALLCHFKDNNIDATQTTSTVDIMSMTNYMTGNIISGNTIFKNGSTYAINSGVASSYVAGNISWGGTHFNWTGADVNTVNVNNISV